MNLHQKRIFVDNLPENVKENEIEKVFETYGNVVSVEIKHRKEGTNQKGAPVFAFVNINIDERSLNQCFRDYSNYDWNGHEIRLQLAKESFLDRLKREREEANAPKISTPLPKVVPTYVPPPDNKLQNKKYYNSDSDSESDTETTNDENKTPLKQKSVEEEKLDYVIKNNKFNASSDKIKIESFCDKPIHVIGSKVKKEVKKDEKSLEAEEKRKKSLSLMKNNYNQQKSAIKSALSSIDTKRNNKIVFDDDESNENQKNKKRNYDNYENNYNNSAKKGKFSLFDEEDEQGDNINFEIKKQFEGEHGQKLLKIQSRYTNDRRFTLDSRFMEENETEETGNDAVEDDEKQKQLEILESVLGKKIISNKPKDANKTNQKPRITMTRFDPSKPEHSKYEIKETEVAKESKKKMRERLRQEEPVDEPKVEVSKDTFYKVKGNLQLQQSTQEKQSFSLLSMFGRTEEKDNSKEVDQDDDVEEINKAKFPLNNNPFKYDSSESEDEGEETGDKTAAMNNNTVSKETNQEDKPIRRETFFFQENDERFHEVDEFLQRLKTELRVEDFSEKRSELKKIIRDKIKNNMRNHRPFRKKLGRSKMIKVKKAKKN